jgi:hypothetical protein
LWSKNLLFAAVMSLLVHVGCGGGNGSVNGRGKGSIKKSIRLFFVKHIARKTPVDEN